MRGTVIGVAAALSGVVSVLAAAQARQTLPFPTPELTGFTLRVERTSDGVALACERGCAWKTLTLACGNKKACVSRITDSGEIGDETKTPLAAFLVRVESTTDGVAFACQRGCAWQTLAFGCEGKKPCASRVSEYGTGDNRR